MNRCRRLPTPKPTRSVRDSGGHRIPEPLPRIHQEFFGYKILQVENKVLSRDGDSFLVLFVLNKPIKSFTV